MLKEQMIKFTKLLYLPFLDNLTYNVTITQVSFFFLIISLGVITDFQKSSAEQKFEAVIEYIQ